jgi:hypothetical protein
LRDSSFFIFCPFAERVMIWEDRVFLFSFYLDKVYRTIYVLSMVCKGFVH